MDNSQHSFAYALKEARLKAGLTQNQVAIKMRLKCEDRLSHWEKGYAIPSVKNLMLLSFIYNVPVQDLYNKEAIL